MTVVWESTDRVIFSLLKSMSPAVYSSVNALAAWSTNVDPSTSTFLGTSATPSPSTSASTPSLTCISASSSSHGLSKAATISISVIIPIFFFLALFAAFFSGRHRCSRRSNDNPSQQSSAKRELENTWVPPQPPAEVTCDSRHEYMLVPMKTMLSYRSLLRNRTLRKCHLVLTHQRQIQLVSLLSAKQ